MVLKVIKTRKQRFRIYMSRWILSDQDLTFFFLLLFRPELRIPDDNADEVTKVPGDCVVLQSVFFMHFAA